MRMKYYFNRSLFDQVNLDSSALTVKTTVVHPINEPGDYAGQVSRNNQVVAYFKVSVRDENTEKAVHIDLSELDTLLTHSYPTRKAGFEVATKGFCVFHVGSGSGGYVVTLGQPGKGEHANPYSTRELVEGDVFTTTILRPGIYVATNAKTKASAEITVPYPKRNDSKNQLKPVSIECSPKGMQPDKLTAQSGAGIIFSIKTDSKISIELKKPIDAPNVYKGPEDVPRSYERKVCAVLNSSANAEFLAQHLDIGKGKDKNRQIAEKIMDAKKKAGQIGGIQHLLEIEKLGPEELTSIVNSLREAHTKLLDKSRFMNKKR
jgi:hypothetical protein